MKIVTFIKKLFRGRTGRYEVWDTSALSNYFERLKQTLYSEDVTLVIPEGVSHEISVGRKNNEKCKEIYRFIEGNIRNPRLIVAVTEDAARSWSVDEQVIYTANKYFERGFNTTLITCDRDQSLRAKLKKVDVKLLPVMKHNAELKRAVNDSSEVKNTTTSKVETSEPTPVPASDSGESSCKANKEFDLPAKTVGKQCWLAFDKHVSVYDPKGKRKISRPEGTPITRDDMVYYNDVPYVIKQIGIHKVTLEMCSAS